MDTETAILEVSIPFREDLHSDKIKTDGDDRRGEFPSLSGKTFIRTCVAVRVSAEWQSLVSIPFREDLHSDTPSKLISIPSPAVYVSIPFREDLHSDIFVKY